MSSSEMMLTWRKLRVQPGRKFDVTGTKTCVSGVLNIGAAPSLEKLPNSLTVVRCARVWQWPPKWSQPVVVAGAILYSTQLL